MVDIGGTAKKLQKMSKIAEESYKKMNELMDRMQELEENLERTTGQVDTMERDLGEQRALLEALAREQGLDVEEVLEEADIPQTPPVEATSRPSASEKR